MRGMLRWAARARVTFLLLVTLAALPDAASANEKPSAVAEIEKLGGLVIQIGDEWEVDFHLQGRALTDEDLVHVAALKNVTWLNLKHTKVTSAGLVHLRELVRLRSLHLEETAVSDEGMEHIASLPKLEYLNLYGTQVTDKSLQTLARAKQLRRLYIWRTKVTDAGVTALADKLPTLKIVGGVDLSKLPADFPAETEEAKPKLSLEWVAVTRREDAPARSENGINCRVWFENNLKTPVKLYWISYGDGALKLYATLAAGATREQNTYARNAWLITDERDQPLGYFVAEENDALAVIAGQR